MPDDRAQHDSAAIAAPQIRTWDVLRSLGFEPDTGTMADDVGALAKDFGNFTCKAIHCLSPRFAHVVVLSGVMRTPRTITEVECEMPQSLDSRELGVAWVTWCLDEHAGGAFFPTVPTPWLAEGRAWRHLLPWEKERAERAQERLEAVASEGVIDIFAAAGLNKPNIGILSEEFLAEVRGMPQRNLAVELLRKLLAGEIKVRGRKNVIQARSFTEMLDTAIKRYQNRAIEAAQVLEELIAMAKDMREADKRGQDLGMNEDEVAFYDALEVNDSAVKVLGEPTLQQIARELVESVRANTSIDWTVKESVRAKLRVIVKRILRKYGYPPDKQEKATQTVLEQAELLCSDL
jgi:hypothetical protein